MNPYREIDHWHGQLTRALRRRHASRYHRQWVRNCIRQIRQWEAIAQRMFA